MHTHTRFCLACFEAISNAGKMIHYFPLIWIRASSDCFSCFLFSAISNGEESVNVCFWVTSFTMFTSVKFGYKYLKQKQKIKTVQNLRSKCCDLIHGFCLLHMIKWPPWNNNLGLKYVHLTEREMPHGISFLFFLSCRILQYYMKEWSHKGSRCCASCLPFGQSSSALSGQMEKSPCLIALSQ